MKRIYTFLYVITIKLALTLTLGQTSDLIEIETKLLAPISIITPHGPGSDSSEQPTWSGFKHCPEGQVVTGYKLTEQFQNSHHENDINAIPFLQGVGLRCSKLGVWNNFIPDKVIFDGLVSMRQEWISFKHFYGSHAKHATGFSFTRQIYRESGQFENINKWKILFDGERTQQYSQDDFYSDLTRNDAVETISCPQDFAICGFNALRDSKLNMIIRLKFLCCYFCIPEEINLVVYDFTNNGVTDVHHTVTKKIGIRSGHGHHHGAWGAKTKHKGGHAGGSGLAGQHGPLFPKSKKKKVATNSADGAGDEGRSRSDDDEKSPTEGENEVHVTSTKGDDGPVQARQDDDDDDDDEDTRKKSKKKGSEWISNYNLRARFEAKFGKLKSKGFNWGDTSHSLWSDEVDETDTIVCKALHRCVLKQLTGKCGKYSFQTPSFDFTHIPLYFGNLFENSGSSNVSMDIKIERRGEIWIMIENLTFSKRSRIWDDPKLCPDSSVVTGQQLKFKKGMAFTGLNLECSRLNQAEKYESVAMLSSGDGMVRKWYNSTTEAIGCTFVEFEMSGLKWKTNFEMRFQGEEGFLFIPPGAQNIKRSFVTCPSNYAICGMQTMYDVEQRGQLTDLYLKCCYSCVAQEKTVVLESFTNLGYTDTIQTIRRTVGNSLVSGQSKTATNSTGEHTDMSGINAAGLQAGFAAKFGNFSHGGFNWGETFNSFWTQNEEKTLTLLCKARHLCTFRQLIGKCGDFEIATPYTIKESFPLDKNTDLNDPRDQNYLQSLAINSTIIPDPTPSPLTHTQRSWPIIAPPQQQPQRPPLLMEKRSFDVDTPTGSEQRSQNWNWNWNWSAPKIDPPGEIWKTIKNLAFDSHSVWDTIQTCPPRSVVTSVGLKFQNFEKFQMSGLRAICSISNSAGIFEYKTNLESGHGNETIWLTSNPVTPAQGFYLIDHFHLGSKFKVLWEVIFNENFEIGYQDRGISWTKNTDTSVRYRVACDKNFVVCGIQTKYTDKGRGILTSIRVKCCYSCQPREQLVTLNSFTNLDDVDFVQNVTWVTGLEGLKQSQRLGQSYFSTEEVNLIDPEREQNSGKLNTWGKGDGRSKIPARDLQMIFAEHLNESKLFKAQFNWAQTPLDLWTRLERKSTKYNCKAGHFCTFKQLIGICGEFQISSPFVIKQSSLLKE